MILFCVFIVDKETVSFLYMFADKSDLTLGLAVDNQRYGLETQDKLLLLLTPHLMRYGLSIA